MLFLLVSTRGKELSNFIEGLQAAGGEVRLVESTSGALHDAASLKPDIVIADEKMKEDSPLALVGKLLKVNAMINTAVISSMSEKDFHEKSEGLGVVTQLPMNPLKSDGKALAEKLSLLL